MAPKEAHTIHELKNTAKFLFELPIKKPKHTRNAHQDQSLLISLVNNSCDNSLYSHALTANTIGL